MKHDIVIISPTRDIGQKCNKSKTIRYTKSQLETIFRKGFGSGTSFSIDDDGIITVLFSK